VAATLTAHDIDDGSQVGALLGRIEEPLASVVADGAYDQTGVTKAVIEHTPDAAVIVPPRSTAVPGADAETNPTQRDQHLQHIAEHGRMAWQELYPMPEAVNPPGTTSARWLRRFTVDGSASSATACGSGPRTGKTPRSPSRSGY